MLMQWSESNNLGIPVIDQQHRELYEMLNELNQAMAHGHGRNIAAKVMNRLFPLIREHFEEEEKNLRHINSPAYRQCCAQHTEELKLVHLFLQDKCAGDPSAVIDLLYFLDTLLEGHIDSDRRALGMHADKLIQ